MKTEINDGGPAFPEPISLGPSGEWVTSFCGMSKRDWFAGQALTSIRLTMDPVTIKTKEIREASEVIATMAYSVADAMLKAMEKK